MGNISPNKTRTMLTIEKDLLEEIRVIAEEEERSLNQMIIYMIKQYMKKVNKAKKGVDD